MCRRSKALRGTKEQTPVRAGSITPKAAGPAVIGSVKAHIVEDGALICFYSEEGHLMRVQECNAPGEQPQLMKCCQGHGGAGLKFPPTSVFMVKRSVRC